MNMKETREKKHGLKWVPSLYFTQGLPYTVVMEMSTVFFKAVGTSLETLGIFQGLYQLPWAFKFVWSPLVELIGTKRGWIQIMQGLLAAMFFLLSIIVARPGAGGEMSLHVIMLNLGNNWANTGFTAGILILLFSVGFTMDVKRKAGVRAFAALLCASSIAGFIIWHKVLFVPTTIEMTTVVGATFLVFLVIAFLSATQDIAIDGFYLDALTVEDQAAYSGVRVMCFRLAMMFGGGLLVSIAGKTHSWQVGFGGAFLVFVALALYHNIALPKPLPIVVIDGEKRKSSIGAFTSFLDQNKIVLILLFIVLFRLDDAFLKPMAKPFLMDIGVTVAQIGFLQGVVGIGATIAGTLGGGFFIAKKGLHRGLWVLGIIHACNPLFYTWLALIHKKGESLGSLGLIHVGTVNALENFAVGLGTIAFVNFLMRTCKKEYTSAHYAIATGLMALSGMFASFFSGFIASKIGYMHYFMFCAIASIPGMMILLFLPIKEMEAAAKE